jgi:hypothetical protein
MNGAATAQAMIAIGYKQSFGMAMTDTPKH